MWDKVKKNKNKMTDLNFFKSYWANGSKEIERTVLDYRD